MITHPSVLPSSDTIFINYGNKRSTVAVFLSLSLSLSHTQTSTHTDIHALTHTHTQTCTHTHSLSHTDTCTHTHAISLIQSPLFHSCVFSSIPLTKHTNLSPPFPCSEPPIPLSLSPPHPSIPLSIPPPHPSLCPLWD